VLFVFFFLVGVCVLGGGVVEVGGGWGVVAISLKQLRFFNFLIRSGKRLVTGQLIAAQQRP